MNFWRRKQLEGVVIGTAQMSQSLKSKDMNSVSIRWGTGAWAAVWSESGQLAIASINCSWHFNNLAAFAWQADRFFQNQEDI